MGEKKYPFILERLAEFDKGDRIYSFRFRSDKFRVTKEREDEYCMIYLSRHKGKRDEIRQMIKNDGLKKFEMELVES
jgi:hypothetical protein